VETPTLHWTVDRRTVDLPSATRTFLYGLLVSLTFTPSPPCQAWCPQRDRSDHVILWLFPMQPWPSPSLIPPRASSSKKRPDEFLFSRITNLLSTPGHTVVFVDGTLKISRMKPFLTSNKDPYQSARSPQMKWKKPHGSRYLNTDRYKSPPLILGSTTRVFMLSCSLIDMSK
jgi:hypothetical protein